MVLLSSTPFLFVLLKASRPKNCDGRALLPTASEKGLASCLVREGDPSIVAMYINV